MKTLAEYEARSEFCKMLEHTQKEWYTMWKQERRGRWLERAMRANENVSAGFDALFWYRHRHPKSRMYRYTPTTGARELTAKWVRCWTWVEDKCRQYAETINLDTEPETK